MGFISTLRKGVSNIITNIKKDMAAKAVENKEIKEIEHEAAFQERKKEAVKTAKFRVQLKGKQEREKIKNPTAFSTGYSPGNIFDTPQTKQTKSKKQKKEISQDIINPHAAMDMVNYNPFAK